MLNFQAVLTNVKFDIDCRNVLYFENREAQENYFSVASLFSSAQSINFNAGSLIETTIIYQVQENESINDILSKNYCIIKDNNENATLKYYYYFIKNIMQDSGNQVKVWLELDIFQTYFIDIEFSDCEILKAHLNRFIDNGDGTVSFNGETNSSLFENEELKNFPKRLKKRETYVLTSDRIGGGLVPSEISSSTLEIMDNNFITWVYVYLNKSVLNVEFSGTGFPTNAKVFREQVNEDYMIMPYVLLAFPLMKTSSKFYIDMQRRFQLTYTWDFRSFLANVIPQIQSYILDIRLSQTAPFPNMNYFDQYIFKGSTESETITIEDLESQEHSNNTFAEFFPLGKTTNSSGSMACIIYTHIIDTDNEFNLKSGMNSRTVETEIQYSFNKNEIIGSLKNKKFNPKLLSTNFKEIRVGQGLGNPFIYDAQKMNTNKMLLLWRESLVPGITRSFVACINNDLEKENSIYNEKTFESLLGASISQDTSFPYSENQLQNYLANNKNFFLQNSINRIKDLSAGITGAGINAAAQNYGAAISGAVGSVSNLITSIINEQLTVDNLKNAPESYQNLNGNPSLTLGINDNKTYVEIWEALENELEIANDFMCQYGFTVNKIANIKQFVNTRKYYNYIKANIQETSGINISRIVHERFKEMFARGVRFWNVDSFSYDLENYEKWLEE